MRRLLGERAQPSKLLHLREVATYVEYWPFASRLESSLLLYDLARRHFPEDYQRLLKLRPPHLVRLVRRNDFARTAITTRLAAADSIHYGPFRSRAAAEEFEAGFLDHFQLRRCQEDLIPSPEHPGCVYGEMNRCLRPCQQYVSREEYASETQRVAAFLETDGQSLIESIGHARDRLSESMEFEEAARTHKRLEKVTALIHGRDELATWIEKLGGVAVMRPATGDRVTLWFFWNGRWHPPSVLDLRADGNAVPLDRRVKDAVTAIAPAGRSSLRERQDHLALLAAWYYSSWRDGEWVSFRDPGNLPYRKIVNAIHRAAAAPVAPKL